jgi:predicted permease
MTPEVRRFAARLASFLRPGREDRELAREVGAHLELLEDDLIRRGATPADAAAAARRAFGGVEQAKEQQRDMRSFAWLEDARRDLRFALRSLRRSPGFAAVAILTLAVGIGATTAIFSLIDGLLLRPLPVRQPGELVLFGRARNWGVVSGLARNYDVFSYPQYLYFRQNNRWLPGGIAAVSSWQSPVRFRAGGEPSMANGMLVSGNYFSVLGVAPAAGRVLGASDDRPEAAPVAVLSHDFWTARFNADPAVVGRSVEINRTPFTVVGVAAAGFFGETIETEPPDVWVPTARFAEVTLRPSLLDEPDSRWLYLIGRAAPGASVASLTSALTTELHQWLLANDPDRGQPEARAAIDRTVVEATSGATGISHLRTTYTEPLQILLAIAALVLAIACANVANLLLARTTARQREMSLRLALGAGRGRLLRQLLAESLLLSLLGGAGGVAIAYWATGGLLALVFRGTAARGIPVAADLRLMAFAAAIVVGAAVLFGSAPALRAARQSPGAGMSGTGRLTAGFGRGASLGRAIVAGQVALSLLLIVGSALLVRSVQNLSRQDFGFDPQGVLVVHVDPRTTGYPFEQLAPLYERIRQAVDAQPGVRGSALALYTPLSGTNWSAGVAVAGFGPARNAHLEAAWVRVTPGYFRTMGIRLLLGRRFDDRDTLETPRAAIVNESFVRQVLHGENPIGRRFGFSTDRAGDWEIVGVVSDTKHTDPREPGRPTWFLPVGRAPSELPVLQQSSYLSDLVVRADGDPTAVAGAVRVALRRVDDRLMVTGIMTLEEQVRRSYNQQSIMSVLSLVFGAVALLLATIGLYGLMAYSVARRTTEIAVRMALGAERPQVVWMLVRELLLLVGAGVAVGMPLALAGARLIRAQLFGVTTVDASTLALAIASLTIVAALAGFLPARRAARLNPASALREA